jgi:tight adherence protein C
MMDGASYALILPSGMVLAVGGAMLIVFGARLRRSALTRRIDRLRPPDIHKTKTIRRKVSARDSSLARPEQQGLSRLQQREASRRLARWGIPAHSSQAIFVASRVLCAAGIPITTMLVSGHLKIFAGSHALPMLIAAALGLAGWFLPPLILQRLVKRRAKAAADGLPDALELLVVCVEAGLSLEDGIDRIIGELARSQPALAAELALTSADLKILPSRDQALANLAERVDVPSVRSVVSTLSQTLRYGTPLAQAMRVVAAQMRTEALIDLEERANRLPAIMTVPMMLFIMPVIFLIVGGPAVLRLLDMLAHR